jgi:CheY-like chemotaxis protein/GGDEF domain-containing protein
MPLEQLQALLVADDRAVLRKLARLLESRGCRVVVAAQFSRAESLLGSVRPDLLIVDSEIGDQPLRKLCERATIDLEAGPAPVVMALVPRSDHARVTAALSAGADDVLQKPLVPGEVMARIRAAARLREQLWRRQAQLGECETLGCLPAPAWRALVAEVARQRTGCGACALVHIDHFEHYAASHGRLRIAHLYLAIADQLQAAGGEGVVWGELEERTLAALLTSSDEVAALSWAERLRAALANHGFTIEGVPFTATVSIGVAGLDHSERVAEEHALGAMNLARLSGGDCVVSAQQWQNELRRQSDEPAWIDSANAWDIMIPHPVALYPDDTAEQAMLLFAQTQLAHIPVVDATGQLLGLLSARSLDHGSRKTNPHVSDSIRFVRAAMTAAPVRFDEETPVREIQSAFAADEASVAVVTRHGRPLGLIYRDSLTAVSKRIVRSAFAARAPFSLDSSYLTTPDPCVAEEV